MDVILSTKFKWCRGRQKAILIENSGNELLVKLKKKLICKFRNLVEQILVRQTMTELMSTDNCLFEYDNFLRHFLWLF